MRTAFINELIVQARLHPEVFLVVGDIGYSVIEPFREEFPERFLNAGVAEQNMAGVAAGLAAEGYHVFTYSIANFPTMRCLEQIRHDICYHDLPVTTVAVGAGMAYGNLGFSHHAIQDIGIMRAMPGLTVLSPADPGETTECVQWLVHHPGPSYLRLGKAGEPALHQVSGIDRGPLRILDGESMALVCTGSILRVVLEAAARLRQESMAVAVFSCPWLHPISTGFFDPIARYAKVFVVEEHLRAGGLGSLLQEHLPETTGVTTYSLPETVLGEVGTQDFLRHQAGLDAGAITTRIVQELSRAKPK